MVLILVATGLGLLFLASYAQEQHTTLSRMVLPLTASILIASLYALSFPPVSAFPPDRSIRGRRLLLILTTLGVLVGAISLVLLDLFSH